MIRVINPFRSVPQIFILFRQELIQALDKQGQIMDAYQQPQILPGII
jgi:hypothetical protein